MSIFKRQNRPVIHTEERSGAEIVAVNTVNAGFDCKLFGRSVQSGTPSPTAPIPVVSAANFDFVSCGRELAGVPPHTVKFTDFYYEDTATQCRIKAGKGYTFVFDYRVNKTTADLYAAIGYGESGFQADIIYREPFPNRTAGRVLVNFTTPAQLAYSAAHFYLRIARTIVAATIDVDVFNIAMYEGDYSLATLPPYQPYQPTVAHITETLRSVGEVADSMEVSGGKAELVRRISPELDGCTTQSIATAGSRYILAAPIRTDITNTPTGQALSAMRTVQYETRLSTTDPLRPNINARMILAGRPIA